MESLRLFVAVELSPAVRAVVVAAQEALAAQRLAVRWVDPEGTHVTLKFLGAVPGTQVDAIAAAMVQAARTHAPFTLQTTRLGAFPGLNQARVIWLGIAGDLARLGDLQQDVERCITPLGYPAEPRAFNPHLTLGRTHTECTAEERHAIGRTLLATPTPEQVSWRVDSVSLMRSERGPERAQYTAIVRHSLT